MPTVTSPSQSRLAFELTQEQVLNIAASLASDLGMASSLMPDDFRERHFQLFELFVSKLTEANKSRVLGAMTHQGVLQ
jgi:hypothetical protein